MVELKVPAYQRIAQQYGIAIPEELHRAIVDGSIEGRYWYWDDFSAFQLREVYGDNVLVPGNALELNELFWERYLPSDLVAFASDEGNYPFLFNPADGGIYLFEMHAIDNEPLRKLTDSVGDFLAGLSDEEPDYDV